MKRYPLNDGWYFTPGFDSRLPQLEKPEGEFEPVRLPHTVRLLPFNDFSEQDYQMVSGYLRFFTPPESWQGRRVRVVFEGAAHRARVYLNGQLLASHSCGYTAFTVDLTQHLRWKEENNLTVELDGVSAKTFASQGQTRTAALSLKLASREIFFQETGEWPVLLLDDVLSELDHRRQEFVLKRINGGQVFITCCEEMSLDRLGEGRTFHIHNGTLV